MLACPDYFCQEEYSVSRHANTQTDGCHVTRLVTRLGLHLTMYLAILLPTLQLQKLNISDDAREQEQSA